MNQLQLVLCIFITFFYRHANALPNGAPAKTCISMKPDPNTRHGAPQDGDAPYVIQVDKSYYSVNGTVRVYIKACDDSMKIAGFLIEAREESNGGKPLGNFTMTPENTRHLDCSAANAETEWAAVTQMRSLTTNPAMMLMFEWKPTEMTNGNIQFVATILKNQPTYWLGVKSIVLKNMTPGMNYTSPNNNKCPPKSTGGTVGATPTGNGAISTAVANIMLFVMAVSAKLFI